MNYSRKEIRDTDSISMKNLNDNFKYIWLKLFGNMDSGSDTTEDDSSEGLSIENPIRQVFTSTLAPDVNYGDEDDIWIQFTMDNSDGLVIQSSMDKEKM